MGLFEEASVILEMHGRKHEVIQCLVDERGSFGKAVEFVVRNHPRD